MNCKNWLVKVINSEDSLSVGIDEISDSTVNVYPNPAHSVLNIEGPAQNSIISIFDLSGKIFVDNKPVNNILDISSLQEGIYIIRIINNGRTEWIKFIKK